jgi:thymidylate kinase
VPDLTILLDIDPNISNTRINKSINIELDSLEKSNKNKRENQEGNKYESMNNNFHNKVRNGYLEMANNNRSSWSIVGGHQSESRVADSIWKRVKRLIENYKVT